MTNTQSTDVVPSGQVVGTELVVAPMGVTMNDLRYAIANGLRLHVEAEAITEEDFLLQQLDKGTDESSILEEGLTTVDSILGVPVKITAFRGLRNSDFQDSKLGVYVVIDVTDKDGVTYTVGAGATDVVVKVIQLFCAGSIPTKGWTIFEQAKKATPQGYFPVNLRATADPSGF